MHPGIFSAIWCACFKEYMQQNREQYGLPTPVLSRDPAQSTKATRFGVLPSLGRMSWPPVGPDAQISRSNSRLVMTFSNRLYPHSSFFSMGKISYPVARIAVPTLTLINSSFDSRSIAFFSGPHAVTHSPHLTQELKSIVYRRGTTCGWLI